MQEIIEEQEVTVDKLILDRDKALDMVRRKHFHRHHSKSDRWQMANFVSCGERGSATVTFSHELLELRTSSRIF